MNRDPLVSFNTPFQSGDGLCYPVYPQNYYKTQTTPMYGGRKTKKTQKSQKGGNQLGDYSQPSTVNDYPGDAYLTSLDERYELTGSGVSQPMNSLTESFLNSNMGITYATQAGGRKKKYRGGNLDLESPNAFNQLSSNLGSFQGENSGSLNRAKGQNQKGGNNYQNQNEIVPAEEYYPTKKYIPESSAPVQGMYPVLSGGKYKKYNKKGGMSQPGTQQPGTPQPGTQPFGTPLSGTPPSGVSQYDMPPQPATPPSGTPPSGTPPPGVSQYDMPPLTIQQSTNDIMSGGRYKKYSKKGGNYIFTPGAIFSSQPAEIDTQMNLLAQAEHIPRGGFARKNMSGVGAQMAASSSAPLDFMYGGSKKKSRNLKGGVSDFATTLSSRGPINYPDALSAQRFRYFNKTGTYIPNTQLQYAAAPISTGYEADPNPYPMAYNDYIGGAKNKAAPAKKKAAPAKKKAAPAKKKADPAKKKKSASDKKKK
jgi:hypothetical protein